MRLAILTSNQLRHQYFASILVARFDVVGMILETKKRDPSRKGEGTALERSVHQYFRDREVSEQEFFGCVDWGETIKHAGLIKEVPAGQLNQPEVAEFLRKLDPDYIAVFGSSILKTELITMVHPNHIINMHLGLSPYYRGSGTNFWPLYQEKPEYVGVTIHYLDEGIDSGRIIVQGRPVIEAGDTPHSIGNKTIRIGVDLMLQTLAKLRSGEHIEGVKQDLSGGELYTFKDCSAEHIVELGTKFKEGLINKYLARLNSPHAPKVKIVI